MAAVAELLFLLFALLSNIHAEEIIVRKEADSYTFRTPRKVDLCLISRFVSEEKLVLWNTSDLRPENSTVPEELKRRLSVHSRANVSFYTINNLNHSDSGLYQEQCWTKGCRILRESTAEAGYCRDFHPRQRHHSGTERDQRPKRRHQHTAELPSG
ncbi:carcinoembryonic antigen-related cell adhesion molecule 1-like protein [Lates japonicus]|uniref:Carcinoembryonic antigen-related cell adhesion molecule 1-like protein n=1 Tax=Lates japonicus TaxID=270547 RepID=A0AAD3N4M0_LATJO|nr:carcinoembryonic antigen-related cell adhesion molecule 1-like protein [Lates japonicus]